MRTIARHVGLTPGALYQHFPSKEAILFAYLEDRIDQVTVAVGRAVAAARSPRERLLAYVRTQVLDSLRLSGVRDGVAIFGLAHLFSRLGPRQRQTIGERMRRHVTTLRDILAEGVESGHFRAGLDLTPTAYAILTMCDVVTVWFRPDGRLAPEAVAGLYADLALRMAAADPD